MGQGVRFATGEVSTPSSIGWASFEGLSPLDPSLMVIESPSTLIGEARGLPQGASTRLGDSGVDSHTNGRGGAPSTPVDAQGLGEPVSIQKQKSLSP